MTCDEQQPSTRRALVAGLFAAALSPGVVAAGARPVVTLLGDSITAGFGLPAEASLPVQLQAALARIGTPAIVRGAGLSGDTTAGGLGRVDFSVQPDTSLCVVELGGNDLLQGLDPRATRANLERLIARLKARRIRVVLCGLRAPKGLNAGFARDFDAIFPAAAKSEGVALYPDLLRGVELTPALNQRDGLHPNARGVRIIAAGLAPLVARELRRPA